VKFNLIIFLFYFSISQFAQDLSIHDTDPIISDSSFIVYTDSTEYPYSIYENTDLGIHFRYDEFDYSPIFEVAASSDTTEWKLYSSEVYSIEFQYPEQVILKIDNAEESKLSVFDSTIQIGINYTCPSESDNIIFLPIIEIFFTSNNFQDIAEQYHFIVNKSIHQDNSQRIINAHLLADWNYKIYGVNKEADVLNGHVWKGLRTQNLYTTEVFLLHNFSDSLTIIASYFDGIRDPNCPYGIDINEHHYYKIVESIRKL
jgi:hypothetical protein